MSTDQFLYLAFYFTIFLGLFNSAKIIYSTSCLNKQRKLLIHNNGYRISHPNIFLIIPVLRESSVIENTLDSFSKLEYPKDKLKIVVVTTEREYEVPQSGLNTIEVVKRKIESLNNKLASQIFLTIHYPHKRGVKSDQINYAIRELSNKFQSEFN